MTSIAIAVSVLIASVCAAQPEAAATGASSADQTAKELSNPIGGLVSVPFQFNWDTGVGPEDATRFTLNVQPVVPFSMNKDWN
jgi:hypothetical protein